MDFLLIEEMFLSVAMICYKSHQYQSKSIIMTSLLIAVSGVKPKEFWSCFLRHLKNDIEMSYV